jgi:hypothetical protein
MTPQLTKVERSKLAGELAYWYFRLNGFLTIENFILHREPDDKHPGMRTDADLVGIRFHHRNEQGMADDEVFQSCKKPLLVIAEVTCGECKLNGPWTKADRKNVNRLLAGLGLLPPESVDLASKRLYEEGKVDSDGFTLQLVAIGMTFSDRLKRYDVLQVTWEAVLSFIHDRFRRYRDAKKDHGTWRSDGQRLWESSEKNKAHFVKSYLRRLAPCQEGVDNWLRCLRCNRNPDSCIS